MLEEPAPGDAYGSVGLVIVLFMKQSDACLGFDSNLWQGVEVETGSKHLPFRPFDVGPVVGGYETVLIVVTSK